MYFIFRSTCGTSRQSKTLTCKNEEKPEMEPCHEKESSGAGAPKGWFLLKSMTFLEKHCQTRRYVTAY